MVDREFQRRLAADVPVKLPDGAGQRWCGYCYL